MTDEEIKSRALKVAHEVQGFVSAARNMDRKGFPFVRKIAAEIVARVQAVGHELKIPGDEKKSLAVETLALLVRAYTPSRWLSWLPDMILRWALGQIIEAAVAQFKAARA